MALPLCGSRDKVDIEQVDHGCCAFLISVEDVGRV